MAGRSCRPGRCLVACVVIALSVGIAVPTVGQPAVRGLLEALNLAGYPAGERAPAFSGLTPEGRPVSLAALRGHLVLLNFWATWCLECGLEMPALERLHRDFGGRGLAVVGVNLGETPTTVRHYAKERDLTFPLVLDPTGDVRKVYGVVGLPTTFLIGRDGNAIARAIGARDWGGEPARALVWALLAEPTSAPRPALPGS